MAAMTNTIVPHRKLSAEALAAVIDEYVTRDGTELTDAAPKRHAVMQALESGKLVLAYDSESDSCNILDPDLLPPSG
jgi:uncharacterized protein YheU (UPF0270 family)